MWARWALVESDIDFFCTRRRSPVLWRAGWLPLGPFFPACELAATGRMFPRRLGLCAFCVLDAPVLLLWLLFR